MQRGIDVSKYQRVIDWSKVKNQIDFAIIRIGLGMYEFQKDIYFEVNYSKCKELNIPVGIYHYSYALNVEDAKKEAKCVIKWLAGRNIDLPVYLDVEDKSMQNLSKDSLTDIIKTFCTEIEKAGYWAGIYANKWWFENLLDYRYLEELYTIWVAQYNLECTYKGRFDMWQKSSSGKIKGIEGNVDCNIMYRDLIEEIKNSRKENTIKTESEIIKEVLEGKYGNGEERRKNLQAMGLDYNGIQRKINELYGYTDTRKKTEEIAKEIVEKGNWGNGKERIQKLKNARLFR